MNESRQDPKSPSQLFWIALLVVLFGLLAYFFFRPMGEEPLPAAAEQPAPDPNFTTAPEGPKVEVQLPDDTLRSEAPAETASPAE